MKRRLFDGMLLPYARLYESMRGRCCCCFCCAAAPLELPLLAAWSAANTFRRFCSTCRLRWLSRMSSARFHRSASPVGLSSSSSSSSSGGQLEGSDCMNEDRG